MKLRRDNNMRRLPLGIEGVRVRPSLRGLLRDLVELACSIWRQA